MSLQRELPGIGKVTAQSVGNTAHSEQIRVTVKDSGGRTRGLSFAVLLDEDLCPRLQRVPDNTPLPEGDLAPYARLAEEFLESDRGARFFLMLGRVDMDLAVLRREREGHGRSGRPLSALTPRIEQLERAKKAFVKWSGTPDRGELPSSFGPSAPAPFGFATQPHARGAIELALSSGEVASFDNDALISPVTTAIEVASAAGRKMIGFSLRDDPTGYGRPSLYRGLSSKDPRYTPSIGNPGNLGWMAKDGRISEADLIVVEVTVPVTSQAEAFLRRVKTLQMDPDVVVFDASTVHVGKASSLLAAFERRATPEFVLDEIERRIGLEADLTIGRYLAIIQTVAGRCGMPVDEATSLFASERGDRYAIELAEPKAMGI